MQHARRGEDINRQVAQDNRVSENVMMSAYVMEGDDEHRARSNRTYARLLASLPVNTAQRCGYSFDAAEKTEQELREAVAAKNWDRVRSLSERLTSKAV